MAAARVMAALRAVGHPTHAQRGRGRSNEDGGASLRLPRISALHLAGRSDENT
jgi:hypothetical protein